MTRPLAFALGLALLAGCVHEAPVDSGAVLYHRYCASCHGPTGRGDGPAAAALTPRPPDFTRRTATVSQLMAAIDGRSTVRAHGSSDMPVWGMVFEQSLLEDPHTRRTALLEVQALAEYVQALSSAPAAGRP